MLIAVRILLSCVVVWCFLLSTYFYFECDMAFLSFMMFLMAITWGAMAVVI